jgi:hypothetical protein
MFPGNFAIWGLHHTSQPQSRQAVSAGTVSTQIPLGNAQPCPTTELKEKGQPQDWSLSFLASPLTMAALARPELM